VSLCMPKSSARHTWPTQFQANRIPAPPTAGQRRTFSHRTRPVSGRLFERVVRISDAGAGGTHVVRASALWRNRPHLFQMAFDGCKPVNARHVSAKACRIRKGDSHTSHRKTPILRIEICADGFTTTRHAVSPRISVVLSPALRQHDSRSM
jgi:hypothetical protein